MNFLCVGDIRSYGWRINTLDDLTDSNPYIAADPVSPDVAPSMLIFLLSSVR